ncbi:MAG: response regulator [Acidobacteriota bacterium]|nr:response regulator [Acidobacteriota bacterium]
MRRRVLIVENESSIRNLIYLLLGALKCESDVAYTGMQALAMIGRENFDAVVLDLRSQSASATQLVSGIREMRPSLVGRILYITGEVSDPDVMKLIEENCLACVRHNHLLHDVWDRLRLLFSEAESASG